MDETRHDRPDRSALALSSYASSAGFALGELLLLTEKTDDLPEYLREMYLFTAFPALKAYPQP